MARLVRAATDRNPPTSGGGGCQTVRDVPDSKWGSVHAYHKDMVDEFRRLLDERPDFMVELRKKQN